MKSQRQSRRRGPIAAKPWLRHLEASLSVARAGTDPEGPHQVRVAIGRLRVWLRLGGWRILDDDLRWLRRGVSDVRDLDVQLERAPPAAWAAELRRRRGRAQRRLLRLLDTERVASLIEALSLVPPVTRDQARRTLAGLAKKALERGDATKQRWSALLVLHRLRRAIRQTRYALEWLGDDTAGLIALQDALGTAFDRFVALEHLGSSRGNGHLRSYRHELTAELHRATAEARAAWSLTRPFLEALR